MVPLSRIMGDVWASVLLSASCFATGEFFQYIINWGALEAMRLKP